MADLVEPASPAALRHAARAWDEDVERQSRELSGSAASWEFFRDDHWNIYTWPDLEMDFLPSSTRSTGSARPATPASISPGRAPDTPSSPPIAPERRARP
ncbi:MAG: hypothetical protein R2848_13710 [Thermomicrobiales bacterium]